MSVDVPEPIAAVAGPRLDGRKVLVTGAASGLGAACAELACARGARVFATDRDEVGLYKLATDLHVSYTVWELAQVETLPDLVAGCVAALGGLDGLVNAAGVWQRRDFFELSPADFDLVFGINVRALFFLQQAAAGVMVEQGGGSIVNFASTAARRPRVWSSHYAASKAAVVSFTSAAAAALGPQGVRVNSVVPGSIDTPMLARLCEDLAAARGTTPHEVAAALEAGNPMARTGTTREVAEVVMFLLSDSSSYVNGEALGVTGGSA